MHDPELPPEPSDARVRRVHRAVSYIEPRLFESLPLQEVAEVAGGSLYHLHRLFTQVYGISLAAYIRARRLSEAARMLLQTEMSVLSISMRCRYGSQAAFSRAFRRYFEAAPAAFRRGAGKPYHAVGPATLGELRHRDDLESTPSLCWLHEDRPLLGIRGLARPDRLADFSRQHDALVARVGTAFEAVGILGATRPRGRIEFFLGIDRAHVPAPQGLEAEVFPRGLYAVFHHHGPPDAVRHSVAYIAQTWRPGPSMSLASRPSAETFRLDERSADSLDVRLWVGVEPDPRFGL